MPQHKGFVPGQWLADCDRCGFTFRSSKLMPDGEFPGLMVCSECWDKKHPQELIMAVVDEQAPSWTRPEPPWVFIVDYIAGPPTRVLDSVVTGSTTFG